MQLNLANARAAALRWAPVLLAVALTAVFLVAHARYSGLPSAGEERGGWRDWADQGRYIEASRAWAEGDLAASRHWYAPGYPLLGAPFLWLTPHDRFLLPNLGCLLVGCLACVALARRLFPGNRFAPALGAGAFALASVGTVSGLKSWLIPWSSTPSAALTLAALVAVLRLGERPGPGRALLAGAAIGGIALFRPGDVPPVALAAALTTVPWLLRMGCRPAAGIAAAGLAGAAAALGLAFGLIAITAGFGPGGYIALSNAVGFEPRLLPLRWVSLVVSGQPLFDGVGSERIEPGLRRGLIEVFPWIIPGVGGIAACLVGHRASRAEALLAIWLAAHFALLLGYRDLHTLGFWLYGNHHYFKVAQPVLLLFALLLGARLAAPATRKASAAAALAAIVLAFAWRAGLAPLPAPPAPASSAGVVIPPLPDPTMAAIVRGHGSWEAIYFGTSRLEINGTSYHPVTDFRLYPRTDDLLLLPLRRLPDAPGVLVPAAGLLLDPATPAERVRQYIVFGLPCAFGLAGAATCGTAGVPLIPPR